MLDIWERNVVPSVGERSGLITRRMVLFLFSPEYSVQVDIHLWLLLSMIALKCAFLDDPADCVCSHS